MEPLQKLKILLVDRAANYTDEYLSLVLDEAEAEALAYCRREDVPDGLAVAVVRMAAGEGQPHRIGWPFLTGVQRNLGSLY